MNEATVKLYNILSEIGILEKGKNYSKIELILTTDAKPLLKTEEVIIREDFGKYNSEHIFNAKFIDIEV